MGVPALYTAFLMAIENLVAGLARDAELPKEFRHRLAGEATNCSFRP